MNKTLTGLKDSSRKANTRNRNQTFSAVVADNEDPEGLQKVRVTCPQLYGENLSPWCICDTVMGGDGFGLVITPQIGDTINIQINNDDIAAPRYSLSARQIGNIPPEEFAQAKINGLKTPSGVTIIWNDEDGSIKLTNGGSSFVYINGDNEIWASGEKVYTSGNTYLNEGTRNIALGGPYIKCPVTGQDIPFSASCFAKET